MDQSAISAAPASNTHPLYSKYLAAMHRAGMIEQAMPPERALPMMAQAEQSARMKMAQAANMGATQGYAEGGAVDVGGAMVRGPGTGKSDSIPAVIDGKKTSALSTGEIVFPKQVVEFYGTKVLDAMVEKAKLAMRKQAIA